jgi:hypothetical protein
MVAAMPPEPRNLASARRIEDGAGLPVLGNALPDLPDDLPEILTADLDDATTAYVLEARVAFDGMRRAAAQLAGLLLVAATGGRSGQDHPMLALAIEAHRAAADTLHGLTAPPRATHHHRHLMQAEHALSVALERARGHLHLTEEAQTAISRPLSSAIDHLRWAGGALPGFEIVAFSQGCCAAHVPTKLTSDAPTLRGA